MITVSATEASKGFSELVNRVRFEGETVVIERNGKPVAELRRAPERAVSGAELSARLASAPRPDDAFADDMAAVRRESRAEQLRDPWG